MRLFAAIEPPMILDAMLGHSHHLMAMPQATGSALYGAMFLAGLVGSLTHCAGMCGPFVLTQVGAELETVSAAKMTEWTRLRGALLIPYHLGRFTTYVLLGALAAALVRGLAEFAPLRYVSAGLLALAALVFLLQALGRGAALFRTRIGNKIEAPLMRGLSVLAQPLLARSARPSARYALGVVLGFLPCGLLYGALAASASAGSPAAGAIAMGSFTLGTVPALVAVGMAGLVLLRRSGAVLKALTAGFMLLNAATLSYLAFQALA